MTRKWILFLLWVTGIVLYCVVLTHAQIEQLSNVREHQIQGVVRGSLYYAPPLTTRLYHYPDLRVCMLRGYEGYNSSQGGPWAVVVPCPWEVKK